LTTEETHPHSVIVIDDDPSVRKSLSRLLRAVGYAVETFPSASAFLARPRPDVPHAIACLILDVAMPGLNGLELQEALGEDGPPIVFITGHGNIPMTVRAMKQGAVDFLAKPFDGKDLLDAVATALRRAEVTCARRAAQAVFRQREATLTPREREVMAWVTTGVLNKQIAAELGIKEGTVKVHRGRVMSKMGVPSVAELVKMLADFATHDPYATKV